MNGRLYTLGNSIESQLTICRLLQHLHPAIRKAVASFIQSILKLSEFTDMHQFHQEMLDGNPPVAGDDDIRIIAMNLRRVHTKKNNKA